MAVVNLGRPTGPRLRDLTFEQERQLDNWLTLALVAPPKAREDMPLDYTRALATLARRRGIILNFLTDERQRAGEAVMGKNIPGCVGGSKRRIVVSDERQLATKAGPKVAPYHERVWRDDCL